MTQNQTRQTMSAMDIYHTDFRTLGQSLQMRPSKAFFVSLEKAVIKDLETQGFCSLADQLLESTGKNIDALTAAVFLDIDRGYKSGNYADVTDQGKYSDIIPYIEFTVGGLGGFRKEYIEWAYYDSLNYRRIALNDDIRQVIRRVRNAVRASHLNNVNHMEENIRREYAQQGSRILADAENNARMTETKADEKARAAMDQANRESERIRAEAQMTAKRIREDAEKYADTIREEAEDTIKKRKAEIEATADQTAKERTDQLVEKYLEENQRKMRTESNAEAGRMIAAELARRQGMFSVYDDMCERTNGFQASWISSLNQSIEQLEGIKSEFYRHLHDWQVSLYQADIRPIAERYLELYRIINVDRLIRAEIITGDGQENSPDADDPVIAGLERLNRTLTTFLRRFEASLNGLDMYVYYPQAGDEFDDLKHVSEDDEEPAYQAHVTECILPGIARKASNDPDDETMDDVVIRAVVRLEKTENESV